MSKPVGKPNGTVIKVAAGTASAASAAIADKVLFIRVVADQNVYIEFGSSPTASSSTHYFQPIRLSTSRCRQMAPRLLLFVLAAHPAMSGSPRLCNG